MNPTPLYAPLQHQDAIRLLRINSGSNGNAIDVILEPFRLSSTVKFTALSYVWGDPTPQRWISCNGHRVSITPNLHGALSHLLQRGLDTLLWVDALCINQQDGEEKSAQVAMMRDIYSRATKVVFWLGEQQLFDEAGASLMKYFFQKHPENPFSGKLRDKSLDELSLPESDPAWIGWASLLQRPWFGRVWIVQEFFNAKQSVFISGTVEIPTEALMHCASATGIYPAIQETIVLHSSNRRSAQALIRRSLALTVLQRTILLAGKEDVRVFDLWIRSRLLHATDPRDRVFALLSLQAAVPIEMIDYRKNVAEVYTEIAEKALTIPVREKVHDPASSNYTNPNPKGNQPQRVSRFLACKHRSVEESDLPSWVPDWKPSDYEFIPLTRHFKGTAKFMYPYQHAVIEKRTMSISGTIIDRPRGIVDSMPYTNYTMTSTLRSSELLCGSQANIRANLDWQHFCFWLAKLASPGAARRESLAMFCRTLAFGALPELSAGGDAEYIGGFQALRKKLLHYAKREDKYAAQFDASGSSRRYCVEYETRFTELSAGRKFCVTRNKRLAWIPHYAGLDDEICYLAGCGVPFVIRRKGQSWELLGDCYLSDMRDAHFHIAAQPQLFTFQ